MTLTTAAQSALSLRGIDLETATRYGLTSADTEKDGDWINIPYLTAGEVTNIKRRTLTSGLRVSYDGRPRKTFWNADVLTDSTLSSEPLVVCQDELDAIAIMQSGMTRVVAIPDLPDSMTKAERFGFLETSLKLLGSGEVTIVVTGDEHGHGILNDLSIRIGKARCKWAVYPLGPDGITRLTTISEVLQHLGEQAVSDCIASAQWVFSDGVYLMSELPPIPEPSVHRLGFRGLDDHFGVRRGDFCVVTGIPSHGKSSVLNDIACRMVSSHRWRIAFASFEQMPQTDHQRNLKAWFYGHYGSGNAGEWIDKFFRFLVPGDDDLPTLDWVLERCRIAVIQHNCDMLVVDPWNELDHSRPKDMSLTEYTGHAIKQFKRLARELNVFLVIAAHPAKQKREEGGKYQPPTLYDISDSAHWFNKADLGLTVFRPDTEKNHTQLIINKVRYQHIIGVPGVINTHYLYDQRRYEWTDMN